MKKHTLKVVYIRSSKYDDDGYVLRYWRGVLPSNTLLCLKALTQSVADSGELGGDVNVVIECYDDTVERIPVKRLARENRRRDTRVVVGLAGVQSNQFARAVDLAIEFRGLGVPVMVGGFHVSGMLAMFDAPSPELQRLLDHGVTLVKGEAEAPGVLARILKDALNGGMQPLYDIQELPSLEDARVPQPCKRDLRHFFSKDMATIDTSRGCPFNCSFCTVINVQGHKMRHRSARCVLEAVETSCAHGVTCFFFTDDNFSRNPVWEALFDGLIALRERGIEVSFMMQIDTLAYRLPNFVEKAARAGCYRVFVGMESLNPKNLDAVNKKQNHADDYAQMVKAWHDAHVLVYVGYIIGFPFDTAESVRHDVEALYSQVKVDKAAFFMLTPLPGSEDHRRMVEQGIPMDADLNNFDSVHETFRHPNFAAGEWRATYVEAWKAFYSKTNMINVLLRTAREHYWQMFWTFAYFRYCTLTGTHPMLTGLFPIKGFKRRPNYPQESLARCVWHRVKDFVRGAMLYGRLFVEMQEIWMLTRKPADPRWATLAELREKWTEVELRLPEYDLRGRCDSAREEMYAMLKTASARLHKLSDVPKAKAWGLRRALRAKTKEVDAYLRNFEVQIPSWRQVLAAEKFVSESVVANYEELVIKYVAKRRRVNAYRQDFVRRLKTGHILSVNVSSGVKAAAFELFIGTRFIIHALMHTFSRPTIETTL